VIIFRSVSNSETPPRGRHLEFQYGRHIGHTFAYNFGTKADRNVISLPIPSFSGSRNPVKSLARSSRVGHIGFQDDRRMKHNCL